MLYFITKAGFLIGARIVVVAERGKGPGTEQILACCIWNPPKKRIELWKVPTIFRAGFLPIFRRWGVRGLSVRFFSSLCDASCV
jgi:hypothetical protein